MYRYVINPSRCLSQLSIIDSYECSSGSLEHNGPHLCYTVSFSDRLMRSLTKLFSLVHMINLSMQDKRCALSETNETSVD